MAATEAPQTEATSSPAVEQQQPAEEPLDLSSAEGSCNSVPGFRDAAYEWLTTPEVLQTADWGFEGEIEGAGCSFTTAELGDIAPTNGAGFLYFKGNVICSEIYAYAPPLGTTFTDWTVGALDTLTTSYEQCDEAAGVATYYRVTASTTGTEPLAVDESDLKQLLSRATADPARISSIATTLAGTGLQTFPVNKGGD